MRGKGPKEKFLWRVSLITETPARLVDFVIAGDAKSAEELVADEHEISDKLRNRLVAVREN